MLHFWSYKLWFYCFYICASCSNQLTSEDSSVLGVFAMLLSTLLPSVAEPITVTFTSRLMLSTHKKLSCRWESPPYAYDTIRYDTRCYFNVRSKADMSQLNLPHGNDN